MPVPLIAAGLMKMLPWLLGAWVGKDIAEQWFLKRPADIRQFELGKMQLASQEKMAGDQQKGMADAYRAMMQQSTANQNRALNMRKQDQDTAMKMMMMNKLMGGGAEQEAFPMYMAMMQQAPGAQRPEPYRPLPPPGMANLMRY